MLSVGIILLIIMTLARIGSFLYFTSNNEQNLLSAFVLGLRFDLRTISLILLVILIFGSIRFLKPFNSRRHKNTWVLILSIIFTVLVFFYVIDFAHYSYLNQRLNASVLNYLEDAGISMQMVWESYPVIWLFMLILFLGTGFFFLLRWITGKISHRAKKVQTKQRVVETLVWLILLGVSVFGSLSQYPLRWSDAFGLGTDYKANLALNPFESFFNTLQFRKQSYDPAKLKDAYQVLNQYYNFDDSSKIDFTRTIKPAIKTDSTPNVVLILAESFSAYKSSVFGNPLKTSPFFDSLANNGLLFTRCFTPAYGTARGVWATITSNPDVEAPATASRNPAAVKQKTVINEFKAHDKFYFLGGSTSWANIRGLLQNNIDGLKIYEQENFDLPKIDVWGISDKNLLLEANKILAKNNKPFFAMIQTADNHRPYTIPEEDLGQFKKESVPASKFKAAGFESIEEYNAFRYADFCMQQFFEAASKEAYFRNTIFVIVGDHGIPGNAGNVFPIVYTQQRLTQHHVPLLYYAPAFIKPQKINRISSQIDVIPTAAGLAGLSYKNSSLGRDLMRPEAKEQFAFLFDMDNRQLNILDSSFLFKHQWVTDRNEIYSILNNSPVTKTPEVEKRMQELKRLSEAFYEASKYMLTRGK
jgi:phosphoglycerol transferase MdoB-like AlkP superfamily enzyme